MPGEDPRRGRGPTPGSVGAKRKAARDRELQRQRIVQDVTEELLKVSGRAVDTLTNLLDDPDPAIRLRASVEISNRLWGTPISRSEVAATVADNTVHRVTPAELVVAAKAFLLRQGAAQASDAALPQQLVHAHEVQEAER